MEFVEFETLALADWVRLVRRDANPFGAAIAGIQVRKMDRFVGARDVDGRMVAVIGAAIAQVTVNDHAPFEVVGVGSLLVRKDVRANGVARELMAHLRKITAEMGPDRAMLFCEPHLLPVYSRRDYTQLTDAVWVDQPAGPMIMPLHAMWRPIRPTNWPAGTIRIHGLPF